MSAIPDVTIVGGGAIIGWNYALDALSYRFKLVRVLVRPGRLKLVENGRMLRRNMRREFITADEPRSQLRAQGAEDVGQVKLACLGSDGELRVLKFEQGQEAPHRRKRHTV